MGEAFPSSGEIDPASFPFFVFSIHRESATGSLKVEGSSYHKALYFRSGRLLFASSNDPGDQLGSILVETGKITQEQLDDVNSKVGPGNPLAKLLSESGVVSQRELAEAARSKVEKILSDVIAYEVGSFEFEDGVLPKGAVDLKLATERVALAAVRRIESREFVLRHLGSLDVVLTQRSDDVTDESAILAAQFDGQRSLKEAASLASLEEFDAAKVACAMLFLGWADTGGSPAEISLGAEPEAQLDFGASSEPDFGIAEAGGADETVMLGTAGVPQIDTAATMADAEPMSEPAGDWPGGLAAEAEPETPSSWPQGVGEPSGEPVAEDEPEPTQAAWPTALADDEESPGGEPESAWPTALADDDEAATVVSAAPDAAARRAKPTTEDLAALDALLSTKADTEGPLAPIGKEASPDWQPQFLNQAGTGRRGGPSAASGRGKLGVLIGAVVGIGALAAGGYWYFVMRPASAQQVTAGSTPVVTRPAVPTTQPAPPSTTAEADSGTTTPPTTAAAESTAAPAATPPPTTAAAPPPVTKPATSRPAAAASLDDARKALRAGQLDSAALAFASHAKSSGTHTLQVLVACVAETVTKAVNTVDDPAVFIVPLDLKGRACYRVCWGLFDSESAAEAAAGRVPTYFKSGGSRPRVVTTASILE